MPYVADRDRSGCSIAQRNSVFRIAFRRISGGSNSVFDDGTFRPFTQTTEDHIESGQLTLYGTWEAKAYFGCSPQSGGGVSFVESNVVTYHVENATDPDGDGVNGTNDHCPGDPGPHGSASGCPSGVAPLVDEAKLKPKKIKPPKKAELTWVQTEVASMKILIELLEKGKSKTVGKLTADGMPGENSLEFNGKVNGRALEPGSYRAVFKATDEEGLKSEPEKVGFKIVGK